MSRQPTGKQRAALMFIRDGLEDPANLPWLCQVKGGYSNEAEFIMRLLDRGWVTLALTDEGRQVLDQE